MRRSHSNGAVPTIIAVACLLTPAVVNGQKFTVMSEKRIPAIPYASPYGQSPFDKPDFGALSPDGRSVLILKEGRLVMRPLESEEKDERQILAPGFQTGVSDHWACWSADGKWIYYLEPEAGDSLGTQELWRVEVATLKTERVIRNAARPYTGKPSPSPDGKSIAFHRGPALMIAGADGKGERVLFERWDQIGGAAIIWSPDGTQILTSKSSLRMSLVTVATRQVQALAPWNGHASQIIWPAWSSGPFLCFWSVDVHRSHEQIANYQIWHVSLPQEERTQLTRDPGVSYTLFGAGADGLSLIAGRMPPMPPPNGWNTFLTFFTHWRMHQPIASDFQTTVILKLRK